MRLLELTKPALLGVQSLVNRVRKGITFGVRGFVTDGDSVLLVRHSYLHGWYLPGGGVEPGETALDALRRELVEETGVAMAGGARLVGLYLNREMRGRDHVALYSVDDWRRVAPFQPNGEIRAAEFFPLARLPDEATPATRRRVAEHLSGTEAPGEW